MVGAIIFATATPISLYAARYGVDIDLLTRGAGFGYIGSTVTSLIYASFTFLFLAIEAAIMALALELCFGLPPSLGYLVSAARGDPAGRLRHPPDQPLPALDAAALDRPQPPAARLHRLGGRRAGGGLARPSGGRRRSAASTRPRFGLASGILLALLAQVGEQVDFLRFVPAREPERAGRWWAAVLGAGGGWILPGMLKILLGVVPGGARASRTASRPSTPPSRPRCTRWPSATCCPRASARSP